MGEPPSERFCSTSSRARATSFGGASARLSDQTSCRARRAVTGASHTRSPLHAGCELLYYVKELFISGGALRRCRTTEHENGLWKSVSIDYHFVDDRPPVSLGTALVGSLTINPFSPTKSWARFCVPNERIYFQSSHTNYAKLHPR